jgi:hypothetical protein
MHASQHSPRPSRAARAALVMTALLLAASPLAAQSSSATPPAKTPAKMGGMDHDMGGMNHSMPGKKEEMPSSGWKELDAYHMLMMATWHPAKENGDIAPIRAKAKDMVASAKLLAKSTPPTACATPKLKEAATNLVPQTQGVADLVAKNADNNTIKDALKALHDKFDVLEEGCSPMKHDMKGMKH